MENSQAHSLVRGFAAETGQLLNSTICTNVRLSVIYRESFVAVGPGISKTGLTPSLIPVRIGNKSARAFLSLSYRFDLDHSQEHLTVASSFIQVCTGSQRKEQLCHFDYERNKRDGYPEAHIQVYGDNEALFELNRESDTSRTLEKVHFPVGGRRFRPGLEDVIEFLIAERLADAHEGWRDTLEERRDEYRRVHLRAAVRRDPDTARAVLDELDSASGVTRRIRKRREGRKGR